MLKTTITHFITKTDIRTRVFALAVALMVTVTAGICLASGADQDIQCWVLCKPGDYVNLRMSASKSSTIVGYMECGDPFTTDGTTRNGFVKVLDAGNCESWIYSGFVVMEKPTAVFENCRVNAKNRVACRRWVNGPQVASKPWLVNGSVVSVFYVAGEWAVTNRGYIRREWLEVDPK